MGIGEHASTLRDTDTRGNGFMSGPRNSLLDPLNIRAAEEGVIYLRKHRAALERL